MTEGIIILIFFLTAGFVLFLFLLFKFGRGHNITPETSSMEAWFIGKGAQARSKALVHVVGEAVLLTNYSSQQLEAMKIALEKLQLPEYYAIQLDKLRAERDICLAVASNTVLSNQIASAIGMSTQAFEQMMLIMAEQYAINSGKKLDYDLDVDRHRQLKGIDYEFEMKMAELDKQMAMVKNNLPYHLLADLSNQLSRLHADYDRVLQLSDGNYKEQEKARVSALMDTLRRAIDDKAKGLF